MEDIRSFGNSDLQNVKELLKDIFFQKGKDTEFNEWELAERVLGDRGFREKLCLVAQSGEEIVGYCLLTDAKIEDEEGLALGPVAVKKDFQGQGIGTRLIETGLQTAREAGFPWVAVLGGEFYHRFGFESAETWGVFLPREEKRGEMLKILFFDAGSQGSAQGELTYCDSFYDKSGRLL